MSLRARDGMEVRNRNRREMEMAMEEESLQRPSKEKTANKVRRHLPPFPIALKSLACCSRSARGRPMARCRETGDLARPEWPARTTHRSRTPVGRLRKSALVRHAEKTAKSTGYAIGTSGVRRLRRLVSIAYSSCRLFASGRFFWVAQRKYPGFRGPSVALWE